MKKFGRRSFFKVMGQSAVLLMGLSHRKAFSQAESAGSKKKYKRIDVDVHMASMKKLSGAAPGQTEAPEIPTLPQGQGQMSPTAGGELENIDIRLKDMDENGIDMQVLSWRNIGCSEFEVPDGIRWA